MALWNDGSVWTSSSILWGPAPPQPPPVPNAIQRTKPVKRQRFYPSALAAQPEWHTNYADQLAAQGAALGLAPAAVTASVNDSRHMAHALGDWLTQVREFGPAATAQLEVLRYGTGGTAFDLPVFTPPTPPAGLTAVLPGALTRIFNMVQTIKAAPGYTEGIGLQLGIVGEEQPAPPPGSGTPRITLSTELGTGHEDAVVKFFKDGHAGIWIESRRGGAWEFLVIQTKSPYTDARPLLVAGQAEVREFRARFWDDGQPNGDWCDVAKVTVSP